MSLDNDSYMRAQRDYDAQLPSDYYTRTVECDDCYGDGCPKCDWQGEIEVKVGIPKRRLYSSEDDI